MNVLLIELAPLPRFASIGSGKHSALSVHIHAREVNRIGPIFPAFEGAAADPISASAHPLLIQAVAAEVIASPPAPLA